MKSYLKLTKFGISLFVMISGLAGYAASLPFGQTVDPLAPILLLLGLYLVSAGSFAVNQAQEWRLDKKMPRTASRPLPSGALEVWQAYVIGFVCIVGGLTLLVLLKPLAAYLSLCTVILYNGLYTLFWKKRWAFAAVPGAIPGAMPVLIGYAANSETIATPDALYLFLIMFLWQMPHFWALAVRYKDDYAQGGFPVLPVRIGVQKTVYHIGLYTFAYVALAIAAPIFVTTHFLYVLVVVPLALKVLWEYFSYYRSSELKSHTEIRWLPFFLWTNLSMLAFICAPVFDRWCYFYMLAARNG